MNSEYSPFSVAREKMTKILSDAQNLVQTEELGATVAGVTTIFIDKTLTKANEKITRGKKLINRFKGQ